LLNVEDRVRNLMLAEEFELAYHLRLRSGAK
jgi:hypothetical protein